MSSLEGVRVALLEGRMPRELADLVRRHGGEPYCMPAVRETPAEDRARIACFGYRRHPHPFQRLHA